jgi:hypothetical protein
MRSRRCLNRRRIVSPVATYLTALLVAVGGFHAVARGDQTISTAITGPVNGDGTAITVTSSGTISGGGDGVVATTSGTISTLSVAGAIDVGANGVNNSGSIGLIDNTGLIRGTTRGILNFQGNQRINAITNSGTINGGNAIETYGSLGSLTNSGRITGTTWGIFGGGTVGTLSNSGTISANIQAAYAAIGVTGTLTNTGALTGSTNHPSSGVKVGNGASTGTLTAFTNSGSVGGFYGVFANRGTLGTLTNSGTIAAYMDGLYVDSNGAITSVVNQAGGRIEGTNQSGINIENRIGTIDNSGTITGDYGINSGGDITGFVNRSGGVLSGTGSGYAFYSSSGTLGSFTNQAGGLIEATNYEGVYLEGDGVGTFSNAGVIRSLNIDDYAGVYAYDSITSLTNSGTISGYYGVQQEDAIDSLTNTATGLLDGKYAGLYVASSYDMTVINYGQITGGEKGIYGYYDLGPITNKTGGVISGTNVAGITIEDDARTTSPTITNEAGALITSGSGAGVKVSASGYTPGTVVNAGRIEGATAGFDITAGGLKWIANTGTIAYSGAGTGPAIRVGTGDYLGDATGASGPALTSTGAGARINGTIVNSGTVFHGFRIENQDVTVSADGAAGIFTSGTLNVVNGNLTTTSGTITLDAAISVNGGTGTVFNDGTLRLLGIENVTGNYQQNAGGVTLMELLGTSSGQYGQLNATGSASFAGGLALSDAGLAGGLADGQTFQLFGFGSYTGGFGSFSVNGTSLQSLGGGDWLYGTLKLTEQWTGTTMSLAVSYSGVPEIDPASMASVLSLVVGSLGLAERRLRRRNGRTG